MPLLQDKTPAERKKLILAVVLGVAAVLVLAYNFGLFSSRQTASRSSNNSNRPQNLRGIPTLASASPGVMSPTAVRQDESELAPPQSIIYPISLTSAPEPGRNIFAFYVAPVRSPAPGGGSNVNSQPAPTEMPTPPPPPLVLAGVSPPSVFARTGEFTIEVSGDRFTPATRIYFGGSELPTEFRSPQSLAARVPAQLIAGPGQREIIVRTPDNTLFSNVTAINVVQPPAPQYDFVGYQMVRGGADTAVLRDKRNNEIVNVQRGDTLGGRFRVLGISRNTVEVVDRELNLRYSLAYSDVRRPDSAQQPARPIVTEEEY
jgi:hypothetical protein